ncbi:MAG TPA: VTT domain-containing protein [Candidatus Didemnitutus sp.]|nr:VTT domain-containing protein [Candidatus Didemnitutus sp.]
MADAAPKKNRALLVKLGVAAAFVLIAAVMVARGMDLKALMQQGLDTVRSAGPVAFFTAMALLPAVGAPVLPFSLSVAPLFAERIGLGWVIVFSLLAYGVNIALTYLLATRALRPLLEKLFVRLGYKLPEVESADAGDLIVLLRVTPGIPFCVQNYLLGLARVPFLKYLLISCGISWSMTVALILFGQALLQGQGKIAFIAISVFLALSAAAQLVRKHYRRKKTP